MKSIIRRLGPATFLAGILGGMAGLAWSQQSSPAPPPMVAPEPPQAAQPPAFETQVETTPGVTVLPPATDPPHSAGSLPASAASSIKDIVIDVSDNPNHANPTGRQEPGVGLEWVCPSTARLGQPVTCTLIVKSFSTNRLHNVVIHSRIPAGARIGGTQPKADMDGDLLVWQLGNLEPRQEKRLDVQLVPLSRGSLPCHAFVTFTGSATTRLEVREPKLAIKAIATKQAIVGDPAPVTLVVSNPGDATAERVKVKAALSKGLEYGQGQNVEFNLDNLAPGESRTVVVMSVAKWTGGQTCAVVATAEPELAAEDAVDIDVVAPRVAVTMSGPALRYLDRHATLLFNVSNPGTAVANHVTLSEQVPAGFKVVAATGDGRNDFVSRSVVWFLGDLAPNQNKEVALELVAINPGEYKHTATVVAARGLRAEAELLTRVEGLPALLMELVDTEDPVEVGHETSYEIRVTNTGTKTESNLQLTCTIPDQMELRGAKGPNGCPFKLEGRELVFATIPKLVPRADAVYRVTVRCVAAGDLRFQARVRADGLTQPVLREESTRVYGDQ
jgi:uncharacterized repeat protein (TIGR01451 family)